MKSIAILLALAGSVSAHAFCTGSGAFQTCTDNNGTYTVNRAGAGTYMQGTDNNGTSWTQNGVSSGSTTIYSGSASNGTSWQGNSNTYGGTTTYNGTTYAPGGIGNSSGMLQPLRPNCMTTGCR